MSSIANVFEETNAAWFVFGAQALAIHGVARATADVDITVRLAGSTAQLIAALAKHGFGIHIKPSELHAFIAETRVIPAFHKTSNIPVDIVLAGPGLEELMLERATRLKLQNVQIPVITMEDFLVLKILAGRGKDIQDVQLLLAARGPDIDQPLVARRIAELEQILDQADLTPTWLALAGPLPKNATGKKKR
ncbi:MAG TPA: nucleotidyltransferase [Kofleriaceae bacterium]|nr:nucleotidyltransferase [Kofleriaceae bacterium]